MHARTSERGHDALTSLVFPTYNAAPFVERTWQQVQRFLQQAPGSWEILFVCDGCADDSAPRLEALARNDPERVRVLSYAPNRGKGYAVRHGLMAARGQWRIFTDVDLAYGFDDILRLRQALQQGAEVAIASRLHPDSRLFMPPSVLGYAYRRYLQSLVFSILVRCLLSLKQGDTQAGLKGISAHVAHTVLPRLRCDGFGLDCELLTACARYQVPITEVPVCVRYDGSASTTGFHSIARMVQELWSIRRDWRQATTDPASDTGDRRAA